MKEFKVFQQISETSSKTEKLNLLKQNDTPQLRKLLFLTYNRFLTYRIKKIDMPLRFNTVQPDITEELSKLFTLLAEHETGANESRALIKNLLSRCTEESASWVCKIITRDLKIGVDEGTVCRAFPGLIPEFKVQLANPIFTKGKKPVNRWLTLKYPVVCEEKYDGVRMIAIVKDGRVNFFSREGHDEYEEHGVFAAEILKLLPGVDMVLDGEAISRKFNPDNAVSCKHAMSNRWPFQQAKAMLKNSSTTKAEVKEFLGFIVWDTINLEYFESQGKKGKKELLPERKMNLCSMFERNETQFENLLMAPNSVAHNEEEVKAIFKGLISKGGATNSAVNSKGQVVTYLEPIPEGEMVKDISKPYEFLRTSSMLKVKQFYEMDLRIVGAYEGEVGTQFEGMLGGFELESDCKQIKTKCGSLRGEIGTLAADQRYELWMMHKRGELVGKIVSVSYQDVTATGSLDFPTFIEFRDDKTVTSLG